MSKQKKEKQPPVPVSYTHLAHPSPAGGAAGGRGRGKRHGTLLRGLGGTPVSYTHLDVYKRQGLHRTLHDNGMTPSPDSAIKPIIKRKGD